MPHKLDFNFELSDDDEEQNWAKNQKVPNLFNSKVDPDPDLHKGMSSLSPPSPNDKMKAFLHKFGENSKNPRKVQTSDMLAKFHQDMELSIPNRNDELKEICSKFSQEKPNKVADKKSPIIELNKYQHDKKNYQDSNEEDEENDKLYDLVKNYKNKQTKKIFMQSTPMTHKDTRMSRLDFSGVPTATPNDKMKKLSTELNRTKNDDKTVSNKSMANSEEVEEENDKLCNLAKNYTKNFQKKNFVQSTPMTHKDTRMSRLDFSGVPTATPNDKMKKLSTELNRTKNDDKTVSNKSMANSEEVEEENDKLCNLAKNYTKNFQKKNFMQSTPNTIPNNKMAGLDFSGLPISSPNDRMKKLSENIVDDEVIIIEEEENHVPEMNGKFVNNKKNPIFNSTPRSSLNQSKKLDTDRLKRLSSNSTQLKENENDQVPEMTAKFNNLKKNKITESTPNPLSKSYQRSHNCLEDISNLSIKNNGNKIDISLSDSLNKEMPKNTENSNEKFNSFSHANGQNVLKNFNKQNNVVDQEDDEIEVFCLEISDTNRQKENICENSKLKEKNCNKKSEKRNLNVSNVSMESKKPDLKKICLDHYQNKVLDQRHQDSYIGKINCLESTKKLSKPERPDILKMCQEKFKPIKASNNKTIRVGKATCVLGREFSKDAIQKQNVIAFFK